MAYTIYKTDGTELTTINDGFADSLATGLTLPGPNYVGYGDHLNENLVYLLENFASEITPNYTSLEGQLWYNKSAQRLEVFTGQGSYWPVSGTTIANQEPPLVREGDTWFNTGTDQFSVYDGGAWRVIGPLWTKAQGVSGAIPTTITDNANQTHDIVQIQFGSTIFATLSKDSSFAPINNSIPGFPYINPGITVNQSILGATININVVGDVVGNLTGNVAGDVTGNLYGSVYGPVTGDLVGSVEAPYGNIQNLTSSNVIITGGNISGATSISATNGTFSSIVTGTAIITSGALSGLTSVSATTGQFNNLSSSNVLVAGGNINNTTLTAPTLVGATTLTPATNSNTTAVATTAFVHNVLPTGVIVMWGGSVATIPAGWALCDGTNGTPDLRDRFVVGAGNSYNPAATGGSNTTTLAAANIPAHVHAVGTLAGATASAGNHSHSVSVTETPHKHTFTDYYGGVDDTWGGIVDGYGNRFNIDAYSNFDNDADTGGLSYPSITAAASAGLSVTLSSVGDHTHTVSITGNTASTGSTTSFDTRPLYYALCYIQKVY